MDIQLTHWPAPAKLNLFLHVTGRRADGYHELQTLFQFISLQDTIGIELPADGSIRRITNIPDIPEADDLMVRAALALKRHTGTDKGAILSIEKQIPAGAGLGGGSSDAATTLLALNHLWQTGLTRDELATIGNRLGADVPVFIHGQAAWAEGTGEVLTPMQPEEHWYALIVPNVHVSTAAIFGDDELTRDTPAKTIRAFRLDDARNDLEPVARRRFAEVDKALNFLEKFGFPRMTGSGAGVFVKAESADAAKQMLAPADKNWRTFVVKGVNNHPLKDLV